MHGAIAVVLGGFQGSTKGFLMIKWVGPEQATIEPKLGCCGGCSHGPNVRTEVVVFVHFEGGRIPESRSIHRVLSSQLGIWYPLMFVGDIVVRSGRKKDGERSRVMYFWLGVTIRKTDSASLDKVQ